MVDFKKMSDDWAEQYGKGENEVIDLFKFTSTSGNKLRDFTYGFLSPEEKNRFLEQIIRPKKAFKFYLGATRKSNAMYDLTPFILEGSTDQFENLDSGFELTHVLHKQSSVRGYNLKVPEVFADYNDNVPTPRWLRRRAEQSTGRKNIIIPVPIANARQAVWGEANSIKDFFTTIVNGTFLPVRFFLLDLADALLKEFHDENDWDRIVDAIQDIAFSNGTDLNVRYIMPEFPLYDPFIMVRLKLPSDIASKYGKSEDEIVIDNVGGPCPPFWQE